MLELFSVFSRINNYFQSFFLIKQFHALAPVAWLGHSTSRIRAIENMVYLPEVFGTNYALLYKLLKSLSFSGTDETVCKSRTTNS